VIACLFEAVNRTRVHAEEAVPLKLTLPTDLDLRLSGLGAAIGAASGEVVFAYLFGSAATAALRPHSDVDVALFAAPGADAHAVRLAVARACARHLESDAVDVVLLNTAPISLAGRVLMTRQVLLDRDPHLRHRYESLHARMFQDFRIREHRLLIRRDAHG
jgi:predicted nucleotidyltransferase